MAGWIFDLFGWDQQPGTLPGTVSDSTVQSPAATFAVIEPPRVWGRAQKRRRKRGTLVGLYWPAETFIQALPARLVGGGALRTYNGAIARHGAPAAFRAGGTFTGTVTRRRAAGQSADFAAGGMFGGSVCDVGAAVSPAKFEWRRARTLAFLATRDGRLVVLRRAVRR